MSQQHASSRRLLYHRGVDDQAGTFVTDYMESVLCVVLGSVLLRELLLVKRNRRRCGYGNVERGVEPSLKTSVGVVITMFSLTVISLLGGLTHQFLQLVSLLLLLLFLLFFVVFRAGDELFFCCWELWFGRVGCVCWQSAAAHLNRR